MDDSIEFTLNSPLTDEDWDKITDAEFEKTDRVTFRTKSGKTVEFVKRKKGEWIKMSDSDGIYWACSECGENLPRINNFEPQFDLFPRLESIDKTKYCPNCGADLRKEPKRLEGE